MWRPWGKPQDDALKIFTRHEKNCIRPLITVCLHCRELQKMLEEWDSPNGGAELNRDIINSMRQEGIEAAAQVKLEAEMAQAVKMQNKVV